MFSTIANVATEFIKVCEPLSERHDEVEIHHIAGRYVADCLAAIAFGLDDISTLADPSHEFLLNAKKISLNSGFVDIVRRSATFLCPK